MGHGFHGYVSNNQRVDAKNLFNATARLSEFGYAGLLLFHSRVYNVIQVKIIEIQAWRNSIWQIGASNGSVSWILYVISPIDHFHREIIRFIWGFP